MSMLSHERQYNSATRRVLKNTQNHLSDLFQFCIESTSAYVTGRLATQREQDVSIAGTTLKRH